MQNIISSAILMVMTALIFVFVNHEQPEAYMDEIFHIPQAQNYCHGHYTHWNDKITTLPGLYIASQIQVFFHSIGNIEAMKVNCSTYLLRLTNVCFIAGCYLILVRICKLLEQAEKGTCKEGSHVHDDGNLSAYLNAMVLSTFPLLYFFSFIYYTDVGSTFFILLCYYNSLNGKQFSSSFFGIIAVLFRQTNIIWVGFCAAINILKFSTKEKKFQMNSNLVEDIIALLQICFTNLTEVLTIAVPYLFVFLGFVGFVIKNNGIVVGDRSMHEASFNLPQVLYLSLFIMLFFSSYLLTRYMYVCRVQGLIRTITVKKVVFAAILCIVMFLAIYHFTYVHKYLLSDNRHYTFYVWRKLFNRHWTARYLLIPVYGFSWMIILMELNVKCSRLWVLIFIGCCCASLVPQKLLEFRYFIIPYLIFRLNIKSPSKVELFLEFIIYNVINVSTLYLFLYRPFTWPSEAAVQRFMW